MKYIRKVMAAALAITFLIALVIGTGVILSVRNVNVSFEEYSGQYREEYEKTKAGLNRIKGSGLLFVDADDIYGKVTSSEAIAVVRYEKKFPCTVNVYLRERVETFVLKTANGYNVYDELGKEIRSVSGEEMPLNRIDNCPDVLLYSTTAQVEGLAELCGYFKNSFGDLRRLVESVSAEKYLELNVATLTLRGGFRISVSEWTTATEAKIKKAYETYISLGESRRASGMITVADGRDNSGPVAKYSAS